MAYNGSVDAAERCKIMLLVGTTGEVMPAAAMAGGLIGVVLGVTASYTLSSGLGWPVLITNFSIIISFMVCAVTGVFFGWYPARKASNLDPIEALRYE